MAGQGSGVAAQTTSYAPPVVDSVVVSGLGVLADEAGFVPTPGGATVTVTGSGFGRDLSLVTVTWRGVRVPGVILVALDSALSFRSPLGEGLGVEVVVTVAGQTAPTQIMRWVQCWGEGGGGA